MKAVKQTLLVIFFLAPILCLGGTEKPSSQAAALELQNCIVNAFQKEVAYVADKGQIFQSAFLKCKPIEENAISAFQNEGRNAEEAEQFRELLHKSIPEYAQEKHQSALDLNLMDAAYVLELARCPNKYIVSSRSKRYPDSRCL